MSNQISTGGGQKEDKSSKNITICMACNFADEILPPLIIFPTKAKPENYVMPWARATKYPQTRGKFGLQHPRYVDVEIAMSPKGGMTGEIYQAYHEKIRSLYPNVQNVVGRKFCFKVDSGPGRDRQEFLFDSFQTGFKQYPGLPNGTEVGQEWDQSFGDFKSAIEGNRDALFRAREEAEPGKGTVTFDDVALIMYGGTATMINGRTIDLKNAIAETCTPEKLQASRLKCGYFPASRSALKSEQIRHQIVEDAAGDVDNEADPLGVLYEMMEKDNIASTTWLVENGLVEAQLCKRKVNRVTANMIAGRAAVETLPGSRERQHLLAKCSTAGGHFRITRGGGPINGSDMIIGRLREIMLKDAEKMEKKRDAMMEFAPIRDAALDVIGQQNDPANWRVPALKKVLRFMQGVCVYLEGMFVSSNCFANYLLPRQVQLLQRGNH